MHHGRDVTLAVLFNHAQIIHRQAAAAGKAGRGGGGLTVLVEGAVGRWAFDDAGHVFAARSQAVYHHGQPSWRAVDVEALVAEVGGGEHSRHGGA